MKQNEFFVEGVTFDGTKSNAFLKRLRTEGVTSPKRSFGRRFVRARTWLPRRGCKHNTFGAHKLLEIQFVLGVALYKSGKK